MNLTYLRNPSPGGSLKEEGCPLNNKFWYSSGLGRGKATPTSFQRRSKISELNIPSLALVN